MQVALAILRFQGRVIPSDKRASGLFEVGLSLSVCGVKPGGANVVCAGEIMRTNVRNFSEVHNNLCVQQIR
jgi:hypothetical protein